ncbi:MAG: hypothetical protein IIB56_06840 [Planctomycetes bacterium]|nr:hypothetical protein [Planctomycetota bacterium]MCH8120405.1 hypothetical protein [Planctomycetota bacterium]
MNRAQKTAWLLVITISAGFVLSCIAVVILYIKSGMPTALAGFAFMAIAAFGGLGPLIFKKDKGNITFDERDKSIKKRAALAGFGTSYLFVCLACMIPFFILGPKTSISVIWLPNIWAGTFLTAFFVHSVAILIQYGRADKGEIS